MGESPLAVAVVCLTVSLFNTSLNRCEFYVPHVSIPNIFCKILYQTLAE
ncbi:MAG: hypothetical protein LBU34_08990 [Planctomycetaceae bacterium]|nr:hypothetical protein [Planctomycetaceae bacterium]